MSNSETAARASALDEPAIDIRGLAELLNVSVDTAYRRAQAGDVPGFRVGRSWRFFASEVRKHLNRPRDPWAYSPQSRAARRRAS